MRRGLRDGNRFRDVIGSLRAGIDESGHAVRQTQRGTVVDPRGMGMNVDQARDDEFTAGIDCFRRIACNIRLDRRDPAARNRHIPYRIDPERGIDDPPALDDQIVFCRRRPEYVRDPADHSGPCRRAKELSPVEHTGPPNDI